MHISWRRVILRKSSVMHRIVEILPAAGRNSTPSRTPHCKRGHRCGKDWGETSVITLRARELSLTMNGLCSHFLNTKYYDFQCPRHWRISSYRISSSSKVSRCWFQWRSSYDLLLLLTTTKLSKNMLSQATRATQSNDGRVSLIGGPSLVHS